MPSPLPPGPADNVADGVGWCQLGYGCGFQWTTIEIPIPALPPVLQGLRIVHLTDVHMQPRWRQAYDQLHQRLSDDPPDLVLFSGDFVDDVLDHSRVLLTLERFCRGLNSRLGTFAICGNHDGDLLAPRLAAWNVHYIAKKLVRLESETAALELIGLPSVRRASFDPQWVASLPPRQTGVPRIIVAHYPDQVRHVASLKADVYFAGHTHGGQICLPTHRALITHDRLPKRMARGIHQFGPTRLIVSRGFGTTRWPIRLFCTAQVIDLTLQAASR